ncbi:MAG: PrsW family intramembrane metalloprotease, partial [Firmicutes bacterium]|nr:PrsW family intramembrane metalloprotease [Bacillota bacterium]
MNYIENIFVCMVAPLLVAIPCSRGRGRQMIVFFLSGMLACLLSSYISTYIAAIRGADLFAASIAIAPCVEEAIKLFPVIFFLLVFEPNMREAADNAIMTAVGFATFENVCFMVENSAGDLMHL